MTAVYLFLRWILLGIPRGIASRELSSRKGSLTVADNALHRNQNEVRSLFRRAVRTEVHATRRDEKRRPADCVASDLADRQEELSVGNPALEMLPAAMAPTEKLQRAKAKAEQSLESAQAFYDKLGKIIDWLHQLFWKTKLRMAVISVDGFIAFNLVHSFLDQLGYGNYPKAWLRPMVQVVLQYFLQA